MVKKKFSFLVFLFSFLKFAISSQFFNMTEYYAIPNLSQLDDYDRCLTEFPDIPATYCMVETYIKPNYSSVIWNLTEKFSSDTKRSFRHDNLQRGLCINWCKKLLAKYDRGTQMEYYLPKFPSVKREMAIDPNTYEKGLDDRNKHNRLINQCVNYDLKRNYGLMGYSRVEYCITSARKGRNYDELDIAFIAILSLIFVLTVACTAFTFSGNISNAEDESTFQRLKSSFSITRNWNTLIAEPTSDLAKELNFIHSLRFLTMIGVIVAHSVLVYNIFPISNPEFLEDHFHRITSSLLLNGPIVIQTYFAISGFMMAVQFMLYVENKSEQKWSYLWRGIVYRYLRLTPVYLLIILLSSSILIHLLNGPLWNRIAETERTFCRNNWWINLFYINNYYKIDEPCAQHGWYLAADFQLSVIGLMLLMIMWKYGKRGKILFICTIGISYLIPAAVTYAYGYDGAFIIRPHALKFILVFDEMYRNMYIATHINASSYLTGLAGGLTYLHLRKQQTDLRRFKGLVWLWYSLVPVGFGLVVSGYIFYAYEFEKPALWIAGYAFVTRNAWGIICIIFLIGMVYKVNNVLHRLLNLSVFRSLGKCSFCVYLCHPFILRSTIGDLRNPLYLSEAFITVTICSTVLLSYLMGVLMCLCVEMPFSNLQKIFLQRNPGCHNDLSADTTANGEVKLSRDLVAINLVDMNSGKNGEEDDKSTPTCAGH